MTIWEKILASAFVLWLPLTSLFLVLAWSYAFGKDQVPCSIPYECEQINR